MGCFLGCFGADKSKKERRHRRRKQRSPSHSPGAARARHSPSKADRDADAAAAAAPLLATLLELRDSADDQCLAVVAKKKVTFDPNVTAYDAPPIPEGEEAAAEAEEEEGRAAAKGEEAWTLLGPECAKSEAFPLNHRYGNCAGADEDSDYEDCYDDDDDEYEDDEDEEEDGLDGIDECAVDDDEEHGGLLGIARGEEEACESLFLLPAPKTSKDSAAAGAGQTGAAAEAPAPCGNPTALSSVENFSQWKDAKPHTAAPKDSEKENLVTLSDPAPAPAMKQEKPAVSWDYTPRTPSKQEASVDASLSTWLGSSGTPESNYSVRSYSPISREDRPILGALTVEDIKISSANSSPRRSRSPSPSPDDMPILGTVGAYWNCSGAKGGHDDSVTRGGFMKTRSRFGQNLA